MLRFMIPMIALTAVAVLTAWAAPQPKSATTKKAQKKRAAKAKARLPRVLLIGDSISMGYTPPTQALLKGKVDVQRIPGNGGPTQRGLQQLDTWLGKTRWDVIHFNFGLHDLKYMNRAGGLVDPKVGKQQVPIDKYEKNLVRLVKKLQVTGARLIWASTTPVPKGSAGRIHGDAKKYNAVAAKIMKAHDIEINDLYALVVPKLKTYQRPANVHFKPAGDKAMAKQVANIILSALRKPRPTTQPSKRK